jgi:hypothetical protein
MAKFFFFEYIVGLFYSHVFTAPKETYSKPTQLGVTFASGYIAGVVCAVVSHPADSVVSLMGKAEHKGKSIGQIAGEVGIANLATKGLGTRVIMIGTLTGTCPSLYLASCIEQLLVFRLPVVDLRQLQDCHGSRYYWWQVNLYPSSQLVRSGCSYDGDGGDGDFLCCALVCYWSVSIFNRILPDNLDIFLACIDFESERAYEQYWFVLGAEAVTGQSWV